MAATDDRETDSPGGEHERNDGVHLGVPERNDGTLACDSVQELRCNVPQPAVVPLPQSAVERGRSRQRARAVRIEKPVRMPGLHSFAVEAVTQALP